MERFYTCSGSPVKINKIPKIDKDGMITLIDGEKTDFQAYIESFRDECDIETIIARFNNGDVSALSKAQGFYGDSTNIPKSYSEILNMVYEGQRVFENLPIETKQKFGSDFNIWFSQMGSDSWFEKMETPEQKVVKSFDKLKVEEEIKE